jgi:two-component system sensor histidine kinase KdpD
MTEQRLDPDVLLKQVQKDESAEKRGKLKIYLGATPGVGKTYEMLRDALEARRRGVDVVLGIGESHGRLETEEMIQSFEPIPQLEIKYRDKTFYEFNLDAAMKRSPGLILVDEMAHTNVPGLRHPKRWQDIKELLDRGLDVCTTLNVQHIESLNDDISEIIHAPIHETVPDSMIEMADTIEIVDLTPEDLLIRLSEGKVYIPEQIAIAKEGYFRIGNLIALRELALHVVAKRVNTQAFLYRQGQGIQQIWSIVEKLLVCVGPGKESHKLIRAAKRLSSGLKIEWSAVYVDVPYIKYSEEKRTAALQNLNFAAQLGADTRILTGFNAVHEILHFARDQNFTLIMIWKHIKPRMKEIFLSSIADEIMRNSGDIDVYIMTGEEQSSLTPKHLPPTKQTHAPSACFVMTLPNFLLSMSITTVVTVLCLWFFPVLSTLAIISGYLIALTSVTLLGDIKSWLASFVFGAILFDVLFVPPYFELSVPDFDVGLGWMGILLVNLIVLRLKFLMCFQTDSARKMEHQASVLNLLSRRLSTVHDIDNILQSGIDYIADQFNCRIIVLLPHHGELKVHTRAKTRQDLDEKEQGIARWVFELGQEAGYGTNTLSFSKALFLPLLGSQNVLGVVRIHSVLKEDHRLSAEHLQLLEACLHQIAIALEVTILYEQKKNDAQHLEFF